MISQPQTVITEKANFRHLVGDVAWYGVALAASSRFLSVYAIRLGASPVELGLISALPALIVVVMASFGQRWTRHFPTAVESLFWPALGQRLIFLLPFFAPLLPIQWQPIWLVLSVAIPAIPQGVAAVPFTVMMVDSIHANRIMRLTSHRSLAMNVTIAFAALLLGMWLKNAPFPLNYQIMFLVAFGFSLVSLYHCISVRPVARRIDQMVEKSRTTTATAPAGPVVSPWRSPGFRRVAAISVTIQLAFTIIIPIVPLYLVKHLGADEGFMALFALVELAAGALGSVLAPRLARRIGVRPMIAITIAATAFNALIIALTPNLHLALFAAIFSGGCWTAGAGIGLFQLFVENTPEGEMAAYSAAYSQVNNLTSFVGQMTGSLLVTGGMNLFVVLMLGAGLRLLTLPLVETSYFFRLKGWATRRLKPNAEAAPASPAQAQPASAAQPEPL
jgi:predicted MFS family arabinose efflux permease